MMQTMANIRHEKELQKRAYYLFSNQVDKMIV
jgi:hypothetical protein